MNNPYPSETGCCPRFVPEPWQEKEWRWDHKLFLRDRIRCLWYVPLNFGKVMVRDMTKMAAAGACPPDPPLVLSHQISPWRMDLFIEVSKVVPDAAHEQLTASILSKVFEGPYRDIRRWCKEMAEWVQSKGKAVEREFVYYTTCPKCAKHYGKNYIVILAQV
ncbi:MAG: hydrolase [Verrucomicrobiota bacterium]